MFFFVIVGRTRKGGRSAYIYTFRLTADHLTLLYIQSLLTSSARGRKEIETYEPDRLNAPHPSRGRRGGGSGRRGGVMVQVRLGTACSVCMLPLYPHRLRAVVKKKVTNILSCKTTKPIFPFFWISDG